MCSFYQAVPQDSFLGDLVNEISMQTAATEATYAQAQSAAATALQISKDQYIRLNADFDNFRRRTVRCMQQNVTLPVCIHPMQHQTQLLLNGHERDLECNHPDTGNTRHGGVLDRCA